MDMSIGKFPITPRGTELVFKSIFFRWMDTQHFQACNVIYSIPLTVKSKIDWYLMLLSNRQSKHSCSGIDMWPPKYQSSDVTMHVPRGP